MVMVVDDGLPVGVLGDVDLQERMLDLAGEAERATAAFLEALGEWDDRRVWLHERGAAPKGFLVLEAAMTPAQAGAHVHTARSLQSCPVTAAALADGRLSVAKARMLALFGTRGRVREAFREAEETIVEGCLLLTLEQTAVYLQVWEQRLDPDGAAPSDPPDRWGTLRRTPDGRYVLHGDFDPEGGATVSSLLEALVEQLWRNTEGEPVRPSRRQLLADAVVLLCQLATGVGGELRRPSVAVDVELDVLEGKAGGVATIDGDTVITPEQAERLACDCELHPAVITALGNIVAWGEHLRLANRALRRYLAHRDRGCRFPGCSAPVGWCVVHHIVWWTRGGRTTRSNTVLVCTHHHHVLHEGGWSMERMPDRSILLTSPHGMTEIIPERAPPLGGIEEDPPPETPPTADPDRDADEAGGRHRHRRSSCRRRPPPDRRR